MPEIRLEEWLFRALACPADGTPLARDGERLTCRGGHSFPIVDGIPVLLTERPNPTHPYCSATLDRLKTPRQPEVHRTELLSSGAVDPFVQDEIAKTNGNLYKDLRGHLPRYPIPVLRLPPGAGRPLLDVGCNWGRWTLAAARAGYRAVGIDPWIEAVRAGRRVARQLGHEVAFVVADARELPFLDGSFDVSFSYSVLQHFEKTDARAALREMSRVTARAGTLLVQMPNVFGLRQAFNLARQRFRRDRNPFRVRYWRPGELRRTFEDLVGPSKLSVDGYFTLNPQASDLDLLPARYAWVVRASERLRAASSLLPILLLVADSLYIESSNAYGYRASGLA